MLFLFFTFKLLEINVTCSSWLCWTVRFEPKWNTIPSWTEKKKNQKEFDEKSFFSGKKIADNHIQITKFKCCVLLAKAKHVALSLPFMNIVLFRFSGRFDKSWVIFFVTIFLECLKKAKKRVVKLRVTYLISRFIWMLSSELYHAMGTQ